MPKIKNRHFRFTVMIKGGDTFSVGAQSLHKYIGKKWQDKVHDYANALTENKGRVACYNKAVVYVYQK